MFDLDGTLVDSYRPITTALNAARGAFGLPSVTVEQVRRIVGHGLEHLIEQNLGPDRIPEGVALFRETYSRIFREGTLPLPGVPAAILQLAERGILIGVASNKPARFTREILAQVGLGEVAAEVQGPDVQTPPKPHPAMITKVRQALGTSPSQTVYVGDMPLDVESARNAGVPCVLVATGSANWDELTRFPGVPVFRGLAELAVRVDTP